MFVTPCNEALIGIKSLQFILIINQMAYCNTTFAHKI